MEKIKQKEATLSKMETVQNDTNKKRKIKMKVNEELIFNMGTVVHTPHLWQFRELCKWSKRRGLLWGGKWTLDSINDSLENVWLDYRENTCVEFSPRRIESYSSIHHYKNGYKILKFEEIFCNMNDLKLGKKETTEQVDCWVKRNGRWEKQKFVANLKNFGAEEDTYVTIVEGSFTPEVYTSQNVSFKEPYEVKSNKWKIKMMVDQL